ncbi:MAG: sugar 3,4-ketoisomerase [Faecousia sp.]
MQVKKYYFPPHGDERGQLIAIEERKDLPFDIKRVYYIYDTLPGVRRGFHAHRSLEQILVCVHGSCKILLDNGYEQEIVTLDQPSDGLYISNDTWREMYDFSEGAVLLVLASEYYDEADYIRNYEDFLKMVRQKGESL